MMALRDQRRLPWLEHLFRDVRFGCRSLARNPAFTIVAVLALATGLCATITIFSIANAWLLRPLDVREPGELVRVTGPGGDSIAALASDNDAHIRFRDYLQYRDQNQTFSSLVASHPGGMMALRIDGPPAMMAITPVTGNYFAALGVPAAIGRTFTPDDAKPGAPLALVLSDTGWRRFFDARMDVLGTRVFVEGRPAAVVGVLPPSFTGTNAPMVPQIYRVMTETPAEDPVPYGVHVIGRLKPGVSSTQARADLSRVAAQLTALDRATRSIEIYSAHAVVPPMLRGVALLVLLFGVIVAVVLLVVCDNVAILMTIRAAVRRREIGIRLALGATRSRLLAQLLIEAGLLCLAACLLGGYLSYAAMQFAAQFYMPVPMPFALTVKMDWRVVAFAGAAACGTTLLCGLMPALQSLKADVMGSLKDTALSGGVRSSLVVTQMTLSTALLVVAVVLAQSLTRSVSPNRGFTSTGIVMSTIAVGTPEYTPARRLAFMESLLQRLERAPGVQAATVVESIPLTRNVSLQPIELRDGVRFHSAYVNRISRGFFETLGISLIAGRDFGSDDNAHAARLGIVNETLAQRFWPDQSPIGRQFQTADGAVIEVIGLVRDSKYESLSEPATALLYRPIALMPITSPTFLLKISGEPGSMLTLLRRNVEELDPELVPYNAMTLDDRLNLGLLVNRAAAAVAGGMGALALALGALGIYGTMAFLVQQRRREIGIRLALGATPRNVLTLIAGQGMQWTGYGLLLGLGGAWLAAFGLTRFLQGVTITDPLAFIVTPLVLAVSGGIACYLPARRALEVNPADTLRNE
jgi:predicted permease